jgi:hypothetical protein
MRELIYAASKNYVYVGFCLPGSLAKVSYNVKEELVVQSSIPLDDLTGRLVKRAIWLSLKQFVLSPSFQYENGMEGYTMCIYYKTGYVTTAIQSFMRYAHRISPQYA